jgi:hypothetical protein
MNAFSEAWYRAHQAKMTAIRAEPVAAAASAPVIEFCLPHATLLLNTLLRMHWSERRKYQRSLSAEIAALTLARRPGEPFQWAKVTIARHSLQLPDADGLAGGMKPLLDCLLVRSTRHPDGLGFCVDDGPAHMELSVSSVRVKKQSEQRTHVRIERLG